MKKVFSAIDPASFTFKRRLFVLSPLACSAVRMISTIVLIILYGAVIACFISDVPRIQWFGFLLVFFLIDYLVHARRSHYTISELYTGRVPQNNVSLCANRGSLRLALAALEKTETRGGDPWCFLAHQAITSHSGIRVAIERLDVSFDEFERELSTEYEKTKTGPSSADAAPSDQVAYRAQLIERVGVLFIQAARVAHNLGRPSIDEGVLFAALMDSSYPRLTKVLDLFGISGSDIIAALAFGDFARHTRIVPSVTGGFALVQARTKSHRINRTLTSRPTPTLDLFSQDITEAARLGYGGFLIGHEDVYVRMIDILSGSANRNVLLVGEAGTGKETLVAHLAFEIIADLVPGPLFDRRLVSLSLSELLAGISGNDASGRLTRIAEEIIRAGNIVLYIPDIHVLAQTTSTAEGGANGVSLADMLLPILQNNLFPVIGSTYPREQKKYIEQHSALRDLFQPLIVEELSVSDTVRLLGYDALVLEKKHKVTIYFSAVQQAAVLAAKYMHTKPLPSGAQELLAEVTSAVLQRGERIVRGTDVIAAVERQTQVPIHGASGTEAQHLLHLEDDIHKQFIDQEEAVRAVATALRSYRSGLARKGGPIASFLFVGPTGVGKTELSKLLAKINFGSDLLFIRFDMSEYQQKDAISRFIGSPDGSISGALTEAVLSHPYSLLLLDEIEKAHPDILNLFLQVLDDGHITDSLGKKVDFTNTIIIATSNAHSVFIQEQVAQGKTVAQFGEDLKKKLSEIFRPEFLNRFSDIVVFRPLALEHIEQIARLQVASLTTLLQETNGISLEVSDQAIHKIAQLGYDPAFGARPLRKVLDTHIKAVLAQKILSTEIHRGALVRVDIDTNGSFIFS
ncbi:MAG: ATP-dependent Clp protease ATP-binding subunit [Patescibacteria group bacterium]|nr:ATP-dependent Clp protease ATP-binding subunit [Patescibacteria group bacterium]